MIQDLPEALIELARKTLAKEAKEKAKKSEKIDIDPQIADPYSPSTQRTQ